MIGTESPAWNTSHTIRSATGLIAGPDRPPVTFARTGLRVRALIDAHPDEAYVLVYGDIDRFKAYNDLFGHVRRAIAAR